MERDSEAVMWTRPLWPLQLGVKRVQDVELHGFKEAVTLVFKYNRHHHLTAILQVALDVVHLVEGGRRKSLFLLLNTFICTRKLEEAYTVNTANLMHEPNTKAHITVSKKPV